MIVWIGAVAAGVALAFLVGALWYGALFGTAAASLHPAYATAATSGGVVGFELLRCLALATALAVLIRLTGLTGAGGAVLLAVLAWAGFQAAGLAGAVVHEGYPLRLYAIHAGDALAKAVAAALAIALIVSRLS